MADKKSGTAALAIDRGKLRKLLDAAGKTDYAISMEMGYDRAYISRVISTEKISKAAATLLELIYGIKYDQYKPDEPKKEPKAPAQAAQQEAVPQADLTRLEDMLQQAVRILHDNKEFMEQVKGGFRVRTSPTLISQDLSQGVRDGIVSAWNSIKADYYRSMREGMRAAMIDAYKQMFDFDTKGTLKR